MQAEEKIYSLEQATTKPWLAEQEKGNQEEEFGSGRKKL